MMPSRKVHRDWPTCFNPLVGFQWVRRLTLSGMSVGPLFPVDRTGRLVGAGDGAGSRVRASEWVISKPLCR